MEKKCIIIPTYNEKANIGKLIDRIFSLAIQDLSVLIVDDNSPDGTGQLIEQLKQKNSQVDVLHRQKKQGLGPAYVAGFRHALKSGADFILEMDADFSHDPKYLPQILKAVQDADLVLGSRYIKGGGVANWNLARRLVSKFGNIYARFILGLPYKDLTGGYKCFRRQVLESIDLKSLSSVGYNFQIELTYKVHLEGFKIAETPIVFTERAEGKSKFNLKIILESFWKVLMLKFNK